MYVTQIWVVTRHQYGISTFVPQMSIAHVRHINILTWLWGFQVNFLYSVWFSLCSSLFLGIARQWSGENFTILSLKPRGHISNVGYSQGNQWWRHKMLSVFLNYTVTAWKVKFGPFGWAWNWLSVFFMIFAVIIYRQLLWTKTWKC